MISKETIEKIFDLPEIVAILDEELKRDEIKKFLEINLQQYNLIPMHKKKCFCKLMQITALH